MSSRREEERNEKIIRGLMKLPPNRRCINCDSLVRRRYFVHLLSLVCTEYSVSFISKRCVLDFIQAELRNSRNFVLLMYSCSNSTLRVPFFSYQCVISALLDICKCFRFNGEGENIENYWFGYYVFLLSLVVLIALVPPLLSNCWCLVLVGTPVCLYKLLDFCLYDLQRNTVSDYEFPISDLQVMMIWLLIYYLRYLGASCIICCVFKFYA